MNQQKIPAFKIIKKECFKLNCSQSFLKIYDTQLPGKGVAYISYPFNLDYNISDIQEKKHTILINLINKDKLSNDLVFSAKKENNNIGNIYIIPANKKNHWQKKIEAKEGKEGILLTIDPQIISRIACKYANLDRVELKSIIAQSDPLILYLALSLKLNLDSGNYDKIYAESLFHTLSMHLLRHYVVREIELENYCEGLPPYKLNTAINYINNNLDKPIKLKDIANLLNISQFYFCHLFKKSTGVAPYKYVIVQRINKAKQSIEQTTLPLSDIAYECGFSSQSQMTQHFRKCVGVTPKVYRNRLIKNKQGS